MTLNIDGMSPKTTLFGDEVEDRRVSKNATIIIAAMDITTVVFMVNNVGVNLPQRREAVRRSG
ncbi:MAG: hypothetical protein DHS20C11_06210 [Lysobacteraceae bacterium]|nr:MAG: hypothetical protein DHS20C11_06210 [Xanthomonadaceae bacterium]